MSDIGFYRFTTPYRSANGAVTGVRVFPPTQSSGWFGNSASTLPEASVNILRQLHPDIRNAAARALESIQSNNIEASIALAPARPNDVLASDRLAFTVRGTTPEANAAIRTALEAQGLTAGTSGRFQSNPDNEVPAIAAMPTIQGRDGVNYRVIPGGTVWTRSAGAPQFAAQVSEQITHTFGNTNTPGRALALDTLPTPSTQVTSPPPATQQAAATSTRPLIVLDPGHGQYRSINPHTGAIVSRGPQGNGVINDTGAVHRETGITEVQVNDAMTARIALSMRAKNYDVQLTRRIDTNSPMLRDISASDRDYLTQLSNRAPEILPDRFNTRIETGAGRKALHLSVHANAGASPAQRGIEFYTHDDHRAGDASTRLASELRGEFQRGGLLNTNQPLTSLNTGILPPGPYDGVNRALRNNGSADRHVVRGLGTGVGAAVAELGYMTNPQDFTRLTTPQGQKQIAEMVANATDRFQQSRGQTMAPQQQAPSRQAAATPTPAPAAAGSIPRITDDITQPHVAQTLPRLRAWHSALPAERQNTAFNTQDPNYFQNPAHREALLMHFKNDQNRTANAGFAVTDTNQQTALGPKTYAALTAVEAARAQATTAGQSPAAPSAAQTPAASAPVAGRPATPSAPAPAATAPAAPTSAPVAPIRPSMPDVSGLVSRPTGRTTPEQRAERHTENGLRVLGITSEGMDAQQRATALKQYATQAGLPEGATPAQIREQVGKDIRTLQTALRDASRDTPGKYDLGRYGSARDGIDGIAGAQTNGALRRFITDNPGQTALTLVRPATAAPIPAAAAAEPATPTPAPTPPAAPIAPAPTPAPAATTPSAQDPVAATPPTPPATASNTPVAFDALITRMGSPSGRNNPLLNLRNYQQPDPASIITGSSSEPDMGSKLRAAGVVPAPTLQDMHRALGFTPTQPTSPRSDIPADANNAEREAVSATSGTQRLSFVNTETVGASIAHNGKAQQDKTTALS